MKIMFIITLLSFAALASAAAAIIRHIRKGSTAQQAGTTGGHSARTIRVASTESSDAATPGPGRSPFTDQQDPSGSGKHLAEQMRSLRERQNDALHPVRAVTAGRRNPSSL